MIKLIIKNVLFPAVLMACALAVQGAESVVRRERVSSQGCSPTNSGAAGKVFGDSFVEMSLNF